MYKPHARMVSQFAADARLNLDRLNETLQTLREMVRLIPPVQPPVYDARAHLLALLSGHSAANGDDPPTCAPASQTIQCFIRPVCVSPHFKVRCSIAYDVADREGAITVTAVTFDPCGADGDRDDNVRRKYPKFRDRFPGTSAEHRKLECDAQTTAFSKVSLSLAHRDYSDSDDSDDSDYVQLVEVEAATAAHPPAAARPPNELPLGHFTWLFGGQEYQRGWYPLYDERMDTLRSCMRRTNCENPQIPSFDGRRPLDCERRTAHIVNLNLGQTRNPVRLPFDAECLRLEDFGCRFVVVANDATANACIAFVGSCGELSFDTERCTVRPQVRGNPYECDLVQLGTTTQVYLISCADLLAEPAFAAQLKLAIAGKRMYYCGGDDNHKLAKALGSTAHSLQCTFVDACTAHFEGRGLRNAVELAFPGRSLCKHWTNCCWHLLPRDAPLRDDQARYAAMDVAALHALVMDVPAKGHNAVVVTGGPSGWTRDAVLELAARCGKVTSVRMNGSGSAVVVFHDSHGSRQAISTVNGFLVEGCYLRVVSQDLTRRRR